MSRPSNRRGPGRVPVQVARPGGAGTDAGGDDAARGRHRSPDAEGGATAVAASSLVGAPRHRRARPDTAGATGPDDAGPGGLPVRSLARVEAARDAASRSGSAARPVPTTGASGPGAPRTSVAPRTPARSDGTGSEEEAVTDLVARPGRGALPDGPGTGPTPAVLGFALSALALVVAVVVALVNATHPAVLVAVGLAVVGTAISALGLGRGRQRRPLAAAGVAVGLAAILAGVLPMVTL